MLGAGPGGYTAAFRAADLGKRVVLIERFPVLGGVCLHVGCIPSKTLLHVAEVISEARELAAAGVEFGAPKLDLARVRARKDAVVRKLADGLAGLAQRRKLQVLTGSGRFESPNRVRVEGAGTSTWVDFEHAIVAVGSRPVALPGLPRDPRILDSTSALALADVPERLLVVGGGVIGLELATVYEALGSRVSVVELLPQLLAGVDADLVRPLQRRIEARYEAIWCGTRLLGLAAEPGGLRARFEGPGAPAEARFDRALVAVGRTGRGGEIAAERVGLRVDERGFIAVDARQRTHVPHVFAIGDVTGPPLLAHRAMHQAKVAAEVIAGLASAFDPKAVPSVAYTDPELAWAGLSESEARERGVEVEKAVFPWSANARALGLGRGEGLTKLLFSKRDRAPRRGGPGRRARGRADRRGRRGHGARQRRRGSRPRHPPPPDALREPRPRRRAGRGHDHRSAAAGAAPMSSLRAAGAKLRAARPRAPPARGSPPRSLAAPGGDRAQRRSARARRDARGRRAPADRARARDRRRRRPFRRGPSARPSSSASVCSTPRPGAAWASRSPTGACSPWRCARAPGRRRATGAVSRLPRAPSSASRWRSIVTTKRALGFDGGSGNLVERSLGPREQVLAADASGAVGVIVTDRRALGVSPFAGGLFETKLRVEETLEGLAATGNFATVRTSRRLLTFQALTGAWVESPLK